LPCSASFSHSFFFHLSCHHPHLHSFPTRRSSDLIGDTDLFTNRIRSTLVVPRQHDSFFNTSLMQLMECFLACFTDFICHGNDSLDTIFRPSQHYCLDRKSTRLNSSHVSTSYAVFCLYNKILNVTLDI